MDIRHPLYQAIASVLAGILILNPIVAAAAELAVDAAAGGNTHLGAAGNGVPVVNIATPNGAGLSHNKFTDYNVGQNGLILNNATGKAQATQLGGIIVGNPNLKGGAAQKILNEVTGANPSQLRGYTEVAGQSAHVIVANPHGITCNGCGFINTPRATLTTGKPLMDGERLRGYDVDAGEIAIEGAGLNASNIDRFELITRSAKLNADLYAKQLAVVAGRNQVDAESLAATAKADDGSAKPQLAIDSSALGGMYAGAIRLVGTEQGVGVKLAGNMAASGGDIQIDANGQLSLAQTSAAGSLRAKAGDIALNGQTYAAGVAELSATGQLSNSQSLAAGQRVALSAAQVSNSGIVEAGVNPDNSRNAQGDVAITAQNLRNSGSVVASRNLEANASGT
ncbi:filamentous hemagglutinin N-terminal domain-containing protein, partial [Pseudomonas nitroreducens]|uniref:filamentous hemagglutinin N-terminal domain-containing protein n=1 Tax=Pseudomonas nitroreducens TaxID=46680 RepID=UPI001FB7C4AB